MSERVPRTVPLYVVATLLFLSGAAGLIYQAIWTRILHYTFGNTEMAAATVLATFMGGLALGGALGGRFAPRIRRPVLAYGILEGIIALYGLVFTPLLYRMDFIYVLTGPDPGPVSMMLIRFAVGGLLILVPTVAMGMTLPILVRGVVRRENSGKSLSRLYFLNTFGAVCGTFVSGFVLIPAAGLNVAMFVAVALGLIVCAATVVVQIRMKPVAAESLDGPETNTGGAPSPQAFEQKFSPLALQHGALAAAFFSFVTGFIALSSQILWFRLLGILMDGTIYGFSALLSAYLAGVAFGSFWVSRRLDQVRDPWGFYVKLQLGAALGSILTILILPLMPFLISGYIASEQKSPGSVFALKFFLVFLAIATPTFFIGASFPLQARLASVGRNLSSAVGRVYAMDAIGCILGAGLTGLVLIPTIKNLNALLQFMIFFAILVALASTVFARLSTEDESEPDPPGHRPGLLAGFRKDGRIRLFNYGIAVFLIMVIVNPNVNVIRLVNSRYSVEDYTNTIGARVKSLYGDPGDLKNLEFQAEGAVTVVTVHKTRENGLRLRNNGLNEAFHSATEPHYAEEILYLGMLPYLLHPDPKKALLIGLGGGGTLDMMTHGEFEQIEVAELEAEVVKASRFMFGNRSHPLDLPHVKLRVDDGRNALLRHARAKPHTYDIVVSQPSHPWLSGASNLYTVEHFRIVKRNLKPGGMLCQWVNLFRMNEKGFRSLMAAFSKAFPDGHVFQVDENSVFLIGVNGEYKVDPAIIEKRLKEPGMASIAKNYGITLNRVLRMYMFPMETARTLAKGSLVNSDRHPVIETVLPWVGHNTMFRVEDLLKKHSLKSGLDHRELVPRITNSVMIRQYGDYLIGLIDMATMDADALRARKKRILRLANRNQEILQEESLRLKASVHEKLQQLEKAVEYTNGLGRPSVSDHMNVAGWLLEMEKPFLALPRLATVLFMLEDPLVTGFLQLPSTLFPGVLEIPAKLSPGTLKSGVIHRLGQALRALGLRRSSSVFARWIENQPEIYDQLELSMWELLASSQLDDRRVIMEHLDAYVNLGGNDPALLKRILIFYAQKNLNDKVDYIVSILKSLPNRDYQILELARKSEKLNAQPTAIRLLSNLERQPRHLEVDRQDLLRDLIRIKTLQKDWAGLGSYVKKLKEMMDDKAFESYIKETFKDLDDSSRELLLSGMDPI